MLAAAPFWLQATDTVLLIAGALVLVAWIARLLVRRPRGHVLPPLAPPTSGLTLVELILALGIYFGSQAMAVGVLAQFTTPAKMQEPGSPAWRLMLACTDAVKLAVTIGIVRLLAVARERLGPARATTPARQALVVIGAFLVCLPVVTALAEGGTAVLRALGMDRSDHPVLISLRTGELGWLDACQLAAGAILIAPLAEEFLFRGLVFSAAWRETRSIWWGIALSSLAFGLVHLPQFEAVVPLAVLGAILCYVRVRAGLWACVLVHAMFNARTVVYTLMDSHQANVQAGI